MSPKRVEVLERLDDVDRAAWDELAASRSFYVGTRWLAFQRKQESGGRSYYVCVRSDERLVAGVAVFVVERPSSGNYDPRRLFSDAAVSTPITLVGGSRGFLSAPLADDDSALELLLEAVQGIADAHSGGLAWWLYTTSDDAALISARSNVVPRLLNGECVIELVGDGFDDYLQSLPGARRGRVRHDLREFEASGLTIEETRLSECFEQCGGMLAQTQRKHGLDVSDADMTLWLRDLSETSEDSGRVYFCRSAEGHPVGFSLIYSEGLTDYVRATGFDYYRAPHVGEYFVLTCYEPIRAAYARGSKALHLGSGAYRAKARRGASVRPLWAVPNGSEGWDTALTKDFNARQASMLAAEIPRDDLVWTLQSKAWL